MIVQAYNDGSVLRLGCVLQNESANGFWIRLAHDERVGGISVNTEAAIHNQEKKHASLGKRDIIRAIDSLECTHCVFLLFCIPISSNFAVSHVMH